MHPYREPFKRAMQRAMNHRYPGHDGTPDAREVGAKQMEADMAAILEPDYAACPYNTRYRP